MRIVGTESVASLVGGLKLAEKTGYIVGRDTGGTHSKVGVFFMENGVLHRELIGHDVVNVEKGNDDAWLADKSMAAAKRIVREDAAHSGEILVVGESVTGAVPDTRGMGHLFTYANMDEPPGYSNLDWDNQNRDHPTIVLNDAKAGASGALHDSTNNRNIQVLHEGNGHITNAMGYMRHGTGFAVAHTNKQGLPCTSEGGNVSFSPNPLSIIQMEFHQFASAKLGHRLSYNEVCTGQGLALLEEFLLAERYSGQHTPEFLELVSSKYDNNMAKALIQEGIAGTYPMGVDIVEVFAEAYGTNLSNYTLAQKENSLTGFNIAGHMPDDLGIFKTTAFETGLFDTKNNHLTQNVIRPMQIGVLMNGVDLQMFGAAKAAVDAFSGHWNDALEDVPTRRVATK